ncbi:MAG: SufD family Fe-S cluster assembly protein [Nitrososphaerota archaeon]
MNVSQEDKVPAPNIREFIRGVKRWTPCPLTSLPSDVTERSLQVGVRLDEENRSGTYFQIDDVPIFHGIKRIFGGKLEIIGMRQALQRHEWLKDYFWRLTDRGADEFTELADKDWDDGYFVRILEGQKLTFPLQACLFISTDKFNQNVHNVIVAESGSDAQIITGCTIHPSVSRGLHVGITEIYVKRGAKLTFTMVHNWASEFDARPRTAILVEEGATFVSNYVCLSPVRSLQMYPVAYCIGEGAKARFNSILYVRDGSYIDVGTKIVLDGKGSRGEIVSRAIATDSAQAYLRGLLVGRSDDSKGHIECRGLLLSDRASIHAIPRLDAEVRGVELTHEAAIGKIAKEQIEYLMARGFSEEEAEALLVRGFMDVSIFGLPATLNEEIRRIVESASRAH